MQSHWKQLGRCWLLYTPSFAATEHTVQTGFLEKSGLVITTRIPSEADRSPSVWNCAPHRNTSARDQPDGGWEGRQGTGGVGGGEARTEGASSDEWQQGCHRVLSCLGSLILDNRFAWLSERFTFLSVNIHGDHP